MSEPKYSGVACEVLGPAFEGQAVAVGVDEADDFFLKNSGMFTRSGGDAYLRAMGIPPAFFLSQPKANQAAIITAQKSHLRKKGTKRLLLLEDAGVKFQFAAPESRMGWKGPDEQMEIRASTGWHPLMTDLSHGMMRFVTSYTAVDTSKHVPGMFLQIPIFYWRPLVLELGLFKLKSGTCLVDRSSSGQVQVRPSEFNPDVFASLVAGVRTAFDGMVKGYMGFTAYMEAKVANRKDAAVAYTEMLDRSLVPKTVTNHCLQHVDRLEAGRELDEDGPGDIGTELDILEVAAYHAKKLSSVSSRSQAESRLFAFFANRAREAGVSISSGVALKSLLEAKASAAPKEVGMPEV